MLRVAPWCRYRAVARSWSRVYAISTWTLIGYFSLMALAHLVLTVLFYLGIWDTGVGYVLDFDVPAWMITILDGAAAYMLWVGYRRGLGNPWLGLSLTVAASVEQAWIKRFGVRLRLSVSAMISRFADADAA